MCVTCSDMFFHVSLQESASEGLLSSAGRGVEKGSLHKHSSSSRKLGRQEGDGALGTVSCSLGLAPGKSKLKDKLSAIRQDRAERRESLQKQDAIHEVDSSEDETDEGSEDSQDGRRGTTFTPPPLLRPTTVRTGPGGTLPSLCLSPSTPHATFSHTGPSQVGRPSPSHTLPTLSEKPTPSAASAGVKDGRSTSSTEEGVRQERKVLEAGGTTKPAQAPLPFSTPGSAFISVSKDTFLKPTPPQDSPSLKGKSAESQTPDSSRAAAAAAAPSAASPASSPDSRTTTTTTDSPTRSACSSPGIPKEKKEADNRRLCAAAAAAASLTASSASTSSSTSSSTSPVPPAETGVDKVVSQLATVAKTILGPVKLSSAAEKSPKDQKAPREGAPEAPPSDASKQVAQTPHLSPTTQQTASPTASQRLAKTSTQKGCTAPLPPPGRESATTSAPAQPAINTPPPASAAPEPQHKRSDPHTTTAAASSQPDIVTSKKT